MQTYLIRVLDPHFIHCSRKQCLDTQKHTHTHTTQEGKGKEGRTKKQRCRQNRDGTLPLETSGRVVYTPVVRTHFGWEHVDDPFGIQIRIQFGRRRHIGNTHIIGTLDPWSSLEAKKKTKKVSE